MANLTHTSAREPMAASQMRQRKTLVLCFDGTGNKFQGNANDSNIIKVFSMLDREDPNLFAYYQPGIGTYVDRSKLSKTGRMERIQSWWAKTKDQAVGSSFDVHIRGGYQFLMRYYAEGDDIYLFGFSRGAYTAKFLAQMIDSVGLLSSGNEELFRFAWKAFSRWESRVDGTTEKERAKKLAMYHHLKSFRETFSRPVHRIKFLGLFDTVNSVPQFETAFLRRTKFPYAARTSAAVIRHAVSIDERRAKFRVDLISQKTRQDHETEKKSVETEKEPKPLKRADTTRFTSRSSKTNDLGAELLLSARMSSISLNSVDLSNDMAHIVAAGHEQDILEVWFPGDHGDLGGGWPLLPGQPANLTHAPLLWMLREARNAGLPCNEEALLKSHYMVDDPIPVPLARPEDQSTDGPYTQEYKKKFHQILTNASIKSKKHDALSFGGGLPWNTVITWHVMEHLPLRRMDLREDGTYSLFFIDALIADLLLFRHLALDQLAFATRGNS